MDKAIATIVGIVLVLGLIGYAILGQVAGAKDIGDQAAMEQHKVKLMLQDPNIVTGNTLRGYKEIEGVAVSVDYVDDELGFVDDIKAVKDSALFSMKKTYNGNGELSGVDFTQIDLSRK
ncbi:MAG: hypothetical protein ACLKAK_03270 [Alkaliphilus sp.]